MDLNHGVILSKTKANPILKKCSTLSASVGVSVVRSECDVLLPFPNRRLHRRKRGGDLGRRFVCPHFERIGLCLLRLL